MNCATCKENQIKYNDNCYEIFTSSTKHFLFPEKDNDISSCYQMFGLYIKED